MIDAGNRNTGIPQVGRGFSTLLGSSGVQNRIRARIFNNEADVTITVFTTTGASFEIFWNGDATATNYSTPDSTGYFGSQFNCATTGRTGTSFVLDIHKDEFMGIYIQDQNCYGAFPVSEFNKSTNDLFSLRIREPFTSFGALNVTAQEFLLENLAASTVDLRGSLCKSIGDQITALIDGCTSATLIGFPDAAAAGATNYFNHRANNIGASVEVHCADMSALASVSFTLGYRVAIGTGSATSGSGPVFPASFTYLNAGIQIIGDWGYVDLTGYAKTDSGGITVHTAMSQAEVDQTLSDLNGIMGAGTGNFNLAGNNAVPTGGASNTDLLDIVAKGYSFTVNT